MPVTIEDGAWLGAACIVLKGVTIGAGTVVGAGSVITRDPPRIASPQATRRGSSGCCEAEAQPHDARVEPAPPDAVVPCREADYTRSPGPQAPIPTRHELIERLALVREHVGGQGPVGQGCPAHDGERRRG